MNLKREMPSPAPGRNNPKYQHRLGADWLESSLAEKDLGVLIDTKLIMSHLCVLGAKQVLGCIRQSGASRLRDDCRLVKWRGRSKRNVLALSFKEVTPSAWRRVWAVTERCSTGVHPRYLGIIWDLPTLWFPAFLAAFLLVWLLLLGTALPFHTCLHVQSCHLSVVFWEFLYFKVVILCWVGAEIFQLRTLQVSFRQFTDHSSGCCLQPEISSTLRTVDPLWLQSLCRELTV